MGILFFKLLKNILEEKDAHIMIVGADGSGKKTIISKLKMVEKVDNNSTIGFNINTFNYKGIKFIIWDFGNQDKTILKNYYKITNGIIFVVDSNDKDKIKESADELKNMLNDEDLKNGPILVMANKQDIKGCLSPNQVTEELGMSQFKGRIWKVQGTSGVTGKGLNEGLEWMSSELLKYFGAKKK